MLQFLVNISFVLWGISEFLIISRRRAPQNKNIKDRNSLIQIVIPKAGINCGFKKRRAKDLVRSGYDETI
jgi:hypothetical protein